jgi:hypothetical protein
MKYLSEIVRELCWNPSMDDLFHYLIEDRNLEIEEDDVYKVHSIIGDFIDLAYFPNPYENDDIVMNDFVDSLEESVWRKYKLELETL